MAEFQTEALVGVPPRPQGTESERLIRKGDILTIKPEWRDKGDENFTWVGRSDEDGGRLDISAVELSHLPLWPRQTVKVAMVEPTGRQI